MVIGVSTLSKLSVLAGFPVRQEHITATKNRATAFTEELSRYCSTGTACTGAIFSVWQCNFVLNTTLTP